MVGVTSLQALVDPDQLVESYVLAAIDARMGEVYWSLYSLENQLISQIGDIQLSPPEEIDIKVLGIDMPTNDRLAKVGNAWQAYAGRFADKIESLDLNLDCVYPSARTLVKHADHLFHAGRLEDSAVFEPLYVRNDVAKKSNKSLIK
jgi:tRNA threonylcarbamoyladenosine biosynthesis protein TsaB